MFDVAALSAGDEINLFIDDPSRPKFAFQFSHISHDVVYGRIELDGGTLSPIVAVMYDTGEYNRHILCLSSKIEGFAPKVGGSHPVFKIPPLGAGPDLDWTVPLTNVDWVELRPEDINACQAFVLTSKAGGVLGLSDYHLGPGRSPGNFKLFRYSIRGDIEADVHVLKYIPKKKFSFSKRPYFSMRVLNLSLRPAGLSHTVVSWIDGHSTIEAALLRSVDEIEALKKRGGVSFADPSYRKPKRG